MTNKMETSKMCFLINDVIILLINLAIFILSAIITSKESSYRSTITLFLFQLIESVIIVVLNLIMDAKNILSKYKGHNNYGMFIRFLLFYLITSCVVLTFQRSNNIDQDEIQILGTILLYIGLINDFFIISSMILSFMVSDKKIYSKKKDEEEKIFNINNMDQMDIFENDKSSANMTELAKRGDN
jgi:hypothetical protein